MQERTLEDLKQDIALIVASAESDWDDCDEPNLGDILEQLLFRLRVVGEDEIPDDYKHVVGGQMVGRIDRCDLKIEHDARVCGKPAAHR